MDLQLGSWRQFRGVIRQKGVSCPHKPFPATGNALVVRHLVIYQTPPDVVLGFIRWAIGHPPKDDPDPIAGVTGWALSLHVTKLLRVTDKWLARN
jgi:hypothetical protein